MSEESTVIETTSHFSLGKQSNALTKIDFTLAFRCSFPSAKKIASERRRRW